MRRWRVGSVCVLLADVKSPPLVCGRDLRRCACGGRAFMASKGEGAGGDDEERCRICRSCAEKRSLSTNTAKRKQQGECFSHITTTRHKKDEQRTRKNPTAAAKSAGSGPLLGRNLRLPTPGGVKCGEIAHRFGCRTTAIRPVKKERARLDEGRRDYGSSRRWRVGLSLIVNMLRSIFCFLCHTLLHVFGIWLVFLP